MNQQHFLLLSRLTIRDIEGVIQHPQSSVLEVRVRPWNDESSQVVTAMVNVFGLLRCGEFPFILAQSDTQSYFQGQWVIIPGSPEDPIHLSQRLITMPVGFCQPFEQLLLTIHMLIRKVFEPVAV